MTSSSFTEFAETRRHSEQSPWTYEQLDQRQREIAARVEKGEKGCVLLSEVAPVITMGRRTKPEDLLLPREAYARAGVTLYPTDRGGLATWHGPGQWVLFIVESLERVTGDSRGVRAAVCSLLEIAREAGSEFDPKLEIREGAELGVWSKRGKVASVGIHVKNRVLLHGLSVNVVPTERSFFGLRPCGLDLPVDFLVSPARSYDLQNLFVQAGDLLIRSARRSLGRA